MRNQGSLLVPHKIDSQADGPHSQNSRLNLEYLENTTASMNGLTDANNENGFFSNNTSFIQQNISRSTSIVHGNAPDLNEMSHIEAQSPEKTPGNFQAASQLIQQIEKTLSTYKYCQTQIKNYNLEIAKL